MRDIFINEVPLIFRKEIYAMACLAGGIVYYICIWTGLSTVAAQVVAALSVIVIRVLSVHFRISLPALKSIDRNAGESEPVTGGGEKRQGTDS